MPTETDPWLSNLSEFLGQEPDFAFIRVFVALRRSIDGVLQAVPRTWFIDSDRSLRCVTLPTIEVSSWDVEWCDPSIEAERIQALQILNGREGEAYAARLRLLSLRALREQKNCWTAYVAANPNVAGASVALPILEAEIQNQLEKRIDGDLEVGIDATDTKEFYAPNRKYTDRHFRRFGQLNALHHSQKVAFDKMASEFPIEINPDRMESFVKQYNKWVRQRSMG